MNSQGGLERRAAQRFEVNLPVSVRLVGSQPAGSGFTQNLSARGVSLCTDFALAAGDPVELQLVMPSEVTLGEDMPVRCRGRVLRVLTAGSESKHFAAVHLEHYEYLADGADLAASRRVSAEQTRACESGPLVTLP